jgi:acyl carrier protein
MTDTARLLDPNALREILVSDIGLDGEQLCQQPQPTLEELGMDSIAQVELGVVLQSRFGVRAVPEDASTMSLDELTARICG